jgi:hypothetical protein
MTDDKIALRALLEKGSDATFLREMIGFAAQRLMELESESLCGAGHGERRASGWLKLGAGETKPEEDELPELFVGVGSPAG